MSKLLSVIVPVYKAERYINKCVNSVLNQTMSDLELILVDDGSPDNSGKICDELALLDNRIKVIHKQNGGPSSARNAGILESSAPFIAFVDQDDYLSPEMYSQMFALVNDSVDVVVCDFVEEHPGFSFVYETFDVHESHDDTIRDFLMHNHGYNIWNMLIRKSVVLDNGLKFPEHILFADDKWFSARLHLYTDRIVKVHAPLYHYTELNEGSITSNLSNKHEKEVAIFWDEYISFLDGLGVYERFKREVYWNLLLLKTNWVFSFRDYKQYYSWHPEANSYVKDNPLLSSKMKIVMLLLNKKMRLSAYSLSLLFRIKTFIKK